MEINQNYKQGFETEQVYQKLQEKARYLQIVNELALALLQQSSMDEILWLVAKSAIARLGFEDCVVYLLDETGKTLIQRAAHGPKNPIGYEILDPITIPVGKGIVGSVAATGIAEIIYDTRLDQRYILDDEARLSELAVPIIHAGEVIGVIDSEHHLAHFYTEEHKEILTTIASMASTKIASALSIERLNETVEQLEHTKEELRLGEQRYRLLYDLHPSMFFTLDEHGVLQSLNHFAAEHLGYSDDELINEPITRLYFDSETETLDERLALCLQNPGQLQRWESCLLCKNGDKIWVRETARAVEFGDNEGNISILIVSEDITDVYKLSQELQYHASHDVLTGLYNRREFERHLEKALQTAQLGRAKHVLCYLDLDMFKAINDSCGHSAGDELLRQLADLFQVYIRKSDTLARLGGDEFGVLMENCSQPHALRVAEALRSAVEKFRFKWHDKFFNVGVSIGLVTINETSDSIAGILAAADTACYTAKESGRNRIHVYNENDEEILRKHKEMRWLVRLNNALADRRFRFYYQPIMPVRAEAGTDPNPKIRCEILLRLEDEKGNLIIPDVFLPAAERFGLSVKLDRFVISGILDWLVLHPDDLDYIEFCSINLSSLSLTDSNFPQFVLDELMRTGIAAEKLCLEIAETAVIANLASARSCMGILGQQGCRFTLDDFGSGLSSFTYLKNLAVDFLKIDGTVIRELADDAVDLAMVRAINDIAHMLNQCTIAGSVDNERTFHLLQELGIDYVQGDYLQIPQPLAELVH